MARLFQIQPLKINFINKALFFWLNYPTVPDFERFLNFEVHQLRLVIIFNKTQ